MTQTLNIRNAGRIPLASIIGRMQIIISTIVEKFDNLKITKRIRANAGRVNSSIFSVSSEKNVFGSTGAPLGLIFLSTASQTKFFDFNLIKDHTEVQIDIQVKKASALLIASGSNIVEIATIKAESDMRSHFSGQDIRVVKFGNIHLVKSSTSGSCL
ncbi:hypothetical protein HDU83_004860 [Entophlyctis luteolus]|nr:hypothetical protein HDU83_004860 [Entophlyctis luteolus]